MNISNEQAMALLRVLYAEECMGVDTAGNEYGKQYNGHFLNALRVTEPSLPTVYEIAPHYTVPREGRPAAADKYITSRRILATIFRTLANAIEDDGPQPF